LFEGRNIARLSNRAIPRHRRQIGMVFQDHKLLEDRTVFENIALPMIIAGYSQREMRGRVRAALDHVGLLDMERKTPSMLSTGEQQRVGIARAVVARPKLLIADEPTGNLDPELSLDIMNLFRRFNDVGVTMLIATHDIELLKRLGGRRVVLDEGRVQSADPDGAEHRSGP
jgi:cell division transport system ATP-binding protein